VGVDLSFDALTIASMHAIVARLGHE